ncbi:hypothetical protein CPB85DRAFT_287510 [Mucidula mucida]|nr:hypothetical protein CPB85DRAFT_287510 [Mucidula mucida]
MVPIRSPSTINVITRYHRHAPRAVRGHILSLPTTVLMPQSYCRWSANDSAAWYLAPHAPGQFASLCQPERRTGGDTQGWALALPCRCMLCRLVYRHRRADDELRRVASIFGRFSPTQHGSHRIPQCTLSNGKSRTLLSSCTLLPTALLPLLITTPSKNPSHSHIW